MVDLYETTVTFTTTDEAAAYINGLGFRALPVRNRGGAMFALDATDDFGNTIITFARQHVSNPLAYDFTDVARRAA